MEQGPLEGNLLLMNSESTDVGPELHLQRIIGTIPLTFALFYWLEASHMTPPTFQEAGITQVVTHWGSL